MAQSEYDALVRRECEFASIVARTLHEAQSAGWSLAEYSENLRAAFAGWPRAMHKRIEAEIAGFVPVPPEKPDTPTENPEPAELPDPWPDDAELPF